jgi:hypothetical protein
MTEYHATINLTFDAISEEQALEIAKLFASIGANSPLQPFKVETEVDDVEEA